MQISQESTCVAGPQNCNFIKNETATPILYRGSMNGSFCNTLRLFKNTFFYRTSPVATSDSFRLPACSFIKKELQLVRFSVNFTKFLAISFDSIPPDDCFLCLPVILRSFSDDLFSTALLGNCFYHVQVAEFQPPATIKSISEVLFKHFIQKRDVATRKRSCT